MILRRRPVQLACALSALVLMTLDPVRTRAQEIRFNVVPYRLDNGLKVLLLEDHAVPSITFVTLFRVGSRNERAGRTGLAHLFEHMMFNGARKYGPGEFDRQLESRGGTSNAGTTEDLTVYDESFPREALEQVIDMEADRMSALQITETSLASEREVVKEERRLRVDNSVPGSMEELLKATAYLAHPYGWPVVGWMADLDAVTLDDAREFFRTHYAPNNATVIMVGDFEPARAIDLLGKAFGPIAAQPSAAAVVRDEPPQRGERRALLRKAAQLSRVAVAYHVPGTDAEDLFALDLLQVMLGEGDSSRLVRALVYDKGLATSVSVGNEWRVDPSLFVVTAEAKPGVAADRLEAALLAEIEGLAGGDVADAELRKAKNLRTISLVRGLKTSQGKAEQLAEFEAYFGGYAKLFGAVGKYESVGVEQVKRAAARYFVEDNRSVVTLVPTQEPEGSR
jgi:predicted Zn-dependent peptidase